MDVLSVIQEFKLNLLPLEWVNALWSQDFMGEKEIPQEYDKQMQGTNYSMLMNNLAISINEWNGSDNSSTKSSVHYKKSWKFLIQNKFNHKACISLISCFVSPNTNKSNEKKALAFSSTRAYFALLSIPGSFACNIFHSFLYKQALTTFNNNIQSFPKKDTKDKKNETPSTEEEHLELFTELCSMLDGLSICLKELHLKDEEESLTHTIQTLVKLSQLKCGINIYNDAPNAISEVVLKSYNILEQLCNSDHGEVDNIIKLILRFFLPNLVINDKDNIKIGSNNSLPNDNTFYFIVRLILNFKDDAMHRVKAVVQQLCVRLPKKADLRAKAVSQIIMLLENFSYKDFVGILQWIVSLAHSECIEYRISAIEVIYKIISVSVMPESSAVAKEIPSDQNKVMTVSKSYQAGSLERESQIKRLNKFLLGAILSRTIDISAVLRSKCLSIFGSLILSNKPEVKEIMQELFVRNYGNTNSTLSFTDNNEEYFQFDRYFSSKVTPLPLPDTALPSGFCIIKHTMLLMDNEDVFVRKNALKLICNVCMINCCWISSKVLEILLVSSKDVSVVIRKVIVKNLTNLLLLYPSDQLLVEAWVNGIVPLIADCDTTCQANVIKSVRSIILDNLSCYNEADSPQMKLPWIVLSTIALGNKRILFKFVCRTWSINKTITENTFKCIVSHIGTDNNFAAWFFMVCLTEFEDLPSPRQLIDYFYGNIYNHITSESLSLLVVESIFLNWTGIDSETQYEVCSNLRKSVETGSVPIFLISFLMDISYLTNKDETKNWSGRLVQLSEVSLKHYLSLEKTEISSEIFEEAICRSCHTLGDAAIFHPEVSDDVFNILAKIIDPTFNFPPDNPLAKKLRWRQSVSDTVKAEAVVALGKVCLQNQFNAQKYATVLASVLSKNSKTVVKVNAMSALTDLCVRFTTVVEDNLGDMCVMLRDDDIQVRTHSLKLILQLIQEEYFTNEALFFYLLVVLRDPVSDICELTEGFFKRFIIKRDSNIMGHNFIKAIFFFNDYQGAGCFDKDQLSAKERRIFSLAGITNFFNRGQIYKFMLSNMKDDDRFILSNCICADILDKVTEGTLSLDRVGVSVLKDALFSLACVEMRLENIRNIDVNSLNVRKREAVFLLGKKTFLAEIVKANYKEKIIPTITKLKRMLAKLKSPLVRYLMICLRELMKDYRTEIHDILHDREIAAEVEYDLKDVNQQNDTFSNQFSDISKKQVRKQCELLSEQVLCEKMGVTTSLKSSRAQSISFLRSYPSLATQIHVPTSIHWELQIHSTPVHGTSKCDVTVDTNSNSCRQSSSESQLLLDDESTEFCQRDSHSISSSCISGEDDDLPNISHGKKRTSDETFLSLEEIVNDLIEDNKGKESLKKKK